MQLSSGKVIIGIGVDLVDVRRIARLERVCALQFLGKIYTPYERDIYEKLPARRKTPFLAKRFAAKEACAKALGTGFSQGIRFCDIGVEESREQKPYLVLTGRAQSYLQSLVSDGEQPVSFLSLADEGFWAQAFVLLAGSYI